MTTTPTYVDPLLDAQAAFVKVWKEAGLVGIVPLRFDRLGDDANPPNARARITRDSEDRDAEGTDIGWLITVVLRIPEGDPRRRSIGERFFRISQVGPALLDCRFHGRKADLTEDDQRFGGAGLELLSYAWGMWRRVEGAANA